MSMMTVTAPGLIGGSVHNTPTPSTPTPKKAEASKKEVEKTKQKDLSKDKSWQNDYQSEVLSLLSPYQQAVGQLPTEFQTLMKKLETNPSSTIPHADTMALQLAKQYSPNITATPSHQPKSIVTAEANLKNATVAADSPEGQFNKSLLSLGTDVNEYGQVAPYQQIVKALLGRVQYNTMYGLTPIQSSANWPSWLKDLYTGVTGQTVGKTATGQLGAGGLSVPGLGSISAASTGTTTKKTNNPPPSGGTANTQ